jgi:hypothetical protein
MSKYIYSDFDLPVDSVKKNSYIGVKLVGVLNYQSTTEFVDLIKVKLNNVKNKRIVVIDATEVSRVKDFTKILINATRLSNEYMNLNTFGGMIIITNNDYIRAMVTTFTKFSRRDRVKACKRVADAIKFINGK